ncbi:MAG: type II secretion system protein GspF [Nitrospiraceae bacterium]|nr:MAG: type II secretion system protein GspF [Nitrospiraceae bacterium]
MKTQERAVFYRMVAFLLSQGLRVTEALYALEDEFPKVRAVIERMNAGESFSAAAAAGLQLPTLDSTAIAAGEAAGALDEACKSLAAYYERAVAFQRKMRSLMIYPAFFVVFFFGISGFLLIWGAPQLEAFLDSVAANRPGFQPPLSTQILIAASHAVRGAPVLAATTVVAILASLGIVWKTGLLTEIVSTAIPAVGRVLDGFAYSRFLAVWHIMLKSGLDPRASLERIVDAGVGRIDDSIREMLRRLSDGVAPADAVGHLPPLARRLIRIGLQGGDLARGVEMSVQWYEAWERAATEQLETLAKNALFVPMGLMLALFVYTFFVPVYSVAF